MSNDEEDDLLYLTTFEVGSLLDKLEKEDRDVVEVIMEQNSTLLNCILDMQDFMKEKGYGTKDFKKWIDQKGEVVYH
jgi:hypothetical protein|tara:strand:+ start:99 stop:329 length:231 start_codon:yes stop_codon:yes gene_type:complete